MKLVCSMITAMALIIGVSCNPDRTEYTEPQKNVVNTWMAVKVVRNNEDLTRWLDLAGFQLKLNADRTFVLENEVLPFLRSGSGTWSVDDALYPQRLTLTPASGKAVTLPLVLPVVNGKRNMQLEFAGGCKNNSYLYTLQNSN